MTKAKRYIVKGMVQGVGFRYFTMRIAVRIGVYGFVKNLYDESVEVYAIGTDEQLNNLKQKLIQGPSYSRVDNVTEEDLPIDKNYRTFNIKY